MNNFRGSIPAMEEIKLALCQQTEKINRALSDVDFNKIDIDRIIDNIDAQIKTADSIFTIALVGTFKTGKSTIINSLLDLKGDARLSSEYEPDTAKSIRIAYRYDGFPEAEVDFGGKYPTEKLTWQEAKKYTSQVALNEATPEYRKKAEAIDEVRYFVDVPFLKICNILDLPGTGTGSYFEHTNTTDNKILESDCFFWVLSTNSEPDMETAKNLEKIRHKIIPIINVWQKEAENICGAFTPDEIIEMIQDGFSAYIDNASEAIVYYAGEIDDAQLKGKEVRPEWGKDVLVEKIAQINVNVSSSDKAARITANLRKAIDDCRLIVNAVSEKPELGELRAAETVGLNEAKQQGAQLVRCRRLAKNEISDEAMKAADDIVDIISNASASFIQMKMSNVDFRALNKKRYSEKIQREFEESCIRADSGWIEAQGKEFCENITAILEGRYIEFAVEVEQELTDGPLGVDDLSITDFVSSISDLMSNDVVSKIIPAIATLLTQIILLIIPGGELVDTLHALGASFKNSSGLTNTDKLQAQTQLVVNQARVLIKQQKYPIVRKLKDAGESIDAHYFEKIDAEVQRRKNIANERKVKIEEVYTCIRDFEDTLHLQEKYIGQIF